VTHPLPSVDLNRRRLGRALATFWAGGIGSSHRELDEAIDDVGIALPPEANGSKAEKVQTSVELADERQLWTFVALALDTLKPHLKNRQYMPDDERAVRTQRLRAALQPYGRSIGDDLRLVSATLPTLAETTGLLNVAVLREHIERLHRAAAGDDPAAMLGSAKELIESTIKVVLRDTGHPHEPKHSLPRLAKEAQIALKLHANEHRHVTGPVGDMTKRVLSALSNLAHGIIEFRNTAGTGHGRADSASLGRRHAKMVAGAAIVYSEMLLDTLQDPHAPWRSAREEQPGL
jgi:hypothetical protein